MSDSNRTRLEMQTLDDRVVPSTVTSTITARPYDFIATGTLTTTSVNSSGPVALTTSTNTAIAANGQIDYTSNTNGTAPLVSISGTGTGNETPVNPADSGGRGSFAQTVQGLFSIADTSGSISTPQALTGTVNWLTPTGAAGIDLIGPQSLNGTLDTANHKLQAGWTNATNVGNVSVTLASKANVPTDLAFEGTSAALALDGSLTLDMTARVTGHLLRAASHTAAATTMSAMWTGDNGQSLAADLNVAIYWNTGTVGVHAEGLAPPSWAKRLIVKLDAAGMVSEGNENNNSWTVELSDLLPPPPPPPPPPLPTVHSYAIVPGEQAMLQWRAENGQLLAQSPAIDGFNGPVHLATGDVNKDGVLDVAIGAGAGGGPRVRVVDGRTGADLANFFAYDNEFRGGVHIALGDTNGDGKLELVTGAGDGGGPHVRIINALTGDVVREFFAFDPDVRGGVSVATGDLNGDNRSELIVTPAAGEERVLLALNGVNGAEIFRTTVSEPQTPANVDLDAAIDPISGAVVVTLTPEDGGPLLKFRSQLAAGEPLLVPVETAPVLFFNPTLGL